MNLNSKLQTSNYMNDPCYYLIRTYTTIALYTCLYYMCLLIIEY